MAELITIARPYAEAVFDLAKETNTLSEWSEVLQNLALVASNEDMQAFLENPNASEESKVEIFKSVLGEALTPQAENLLKTLAEHHRLLTLPYIAQLFEALKAEDEKRIQAEVYTAFDLNDEQQKKLQAALNAKYDAEVDIQYQVDPELIGGVKIKVGDWVVDGSALAQLKALGAALTH